MTKHPYLSLTHQINDLHNAMRFDFRLTIVFIGAMATMLLVVLSD